MVSFFFFVPPGMVQISRHLSSIFSLYENAFTLGEDKSKFFGRGGGRAALGGRGKVVASLGTPQAAATSRDEQEGKRSGRSWAFNAGPSGLGDALYGQFGEDTKGVRPWRTAAAAAHKLSHKNENVFIKPANH